MTNTPIPELVEVTQEDREAAAALERLETYASAIRAGKQDASKRVQAFARHRIDALTTSQARIRVLEEALEAEDDYWAASRALASALPRLREGAQMAFAAAGKRREAARSTLSHKVSKP